MGMVLSNKIQMNRGLLQGAPVSGHLNNDHGIGIERSDEELENLEIGVELGRLCAVCDLLRGLRGFACCGGDGGRGDRETERSWSVSWCTEHTLDESTEDDGHKHWSERTGCAVGRGAGRCVWT